MGLGHTVIDLSPWPAETARSQRSEGGSIVAAECTGGERLSGSLSLYRHDGEM